MSSVIEILFWLGVLKFFPSLSHLRQIWVAPIQWIPAVLLPQEKWSLSSAMVKNVGALHIFHLHTFIA